MTAARAVSALSAALIALAACGADNHSEAKRLCVDVLGPNVNIGSAFLETVGKIRTWTDPSDPKSWPYYGAFPGADPGAKAAWCWVGHQAPSDRYPVWVAYAVAPGFTAMNVGNQYGLAESPTAPP